MEQTFPRRTRPGTSWRPRMGRWLLVLLALPLPMLLVLPLVALAWKTPAAVFARYAGQSATAQAIFLSVVTTSATVGLTVLLGTPLAWLMARRRFRGRRFLDVLIDLPMVLPPAVAGLALLMAFGRRGVFGQWLDAMGIQVAFTPVAVVMAQMFVAAPYYIKAATIGMAGVERELEDAAALDGATGSQVFRYVTLPLAWRGLAGGLALCWARALGEFGATIIFAGNYPGRTQTMPLAVYIGFEIDIRQALTLAAILLGISFLILAAIRATLRER